MLSDFWPHGAVAVKYGVLRPEGHSERAIFVVDKRGIIRYIDIHNIDEQPDNEVLFAELSKIDPVAAAHGPVTPPPVNAELPHGGVVMYCTSWCPACRRARAFFQNNNIKYIEVDIDDNPAAALQVKKWANGNRTTPAFDIDGKIMIDFDERKMREILKIA